MDLIKIKEANQIYSSLADKTIDDAMVQLNTYENLDHEVLQLVKSLINNSQKSNTFFDEKISKNYQFPTQKWQADDIVDGYQLLEQIGQGGMSVVFKAIRINSTTQKPVAIKLFNLSNHSAEIQARFQAEQSMLADLSHPNIIEFHHGENTKHRDSYIVMELLDDGMPIDSYAKNKKLNTKQIITLLIQATDALQYAHNQLIIHRDIKPSNILINGAGQLKILDFGIAKLINPEESSSPDEQTVNTLIALTPSFASPEQINAQKVDVTTDVFSLAAVAVYLLTGEQPFPANRMLNSCANDDFHVRQLLKTHITDQDLRNVLTQALHQESQHRYANMFSFNQDLDKWLKQKPVSASKDSWWYRLQRFAARRTALFSTSLVLIGTVLAAIIALTMQNQTIKLEAQKTDAVKQFMLDSFSVTDPNVSQGVDLSSKDLLRVAADKMTGNNDMDPEVRFELYMALALANGRLGYYPEAIALLNNALLVQPKNEQATALLAQYLFNAGEIETVNQLLALTKENQFNSISDKAAIKRVRASLLAQAGEYEQAFTVFDSLQALESKKTDILKNQALLAEMYYLKGESGRSIEIIEQLKLNHPLPATDVFNLGLNSDLVQYHDQVGNFAAAMSLTEENIQSYQLILGDEHPDLGLAYNSLSVFQRLNGQLHDAINSATISEQIFRKRYGNTSEGLAQSLSNTGVAHYYLKNNDLAISNLTDAVAMLTQIFSADHPETINAKANLAVILNATGKPKEALPILQKIHQYEIDKYGESSRKILYTQQALALTLANLGQYNDSINHATESLTLAKEHFSSDQNLVNHSESILGRVYFMAGKHQLSVQHNLNHINKWTSGNENNYARSLSLIANSYFKLDDYTLSEIFFKRWTDHLFKLYGALDEKYLDGLLKSAEYLFKMNLKDAALVHLKTVSKTLNDNNLEFESIHSQLNELKARN